MEPRASVVLDKGSLPLSYVSAHILLTMKTCLPEIWVRQKAAFQHEQLFYFTVQWMVERDTPNLCYLKSFISIFSSSTSSNVENSLSIGYFFLSPKDDTELAGHRCTNSVEIQMPMGTWVQFCEKLRLVRMIIWGWVYPRGLQHCSVALYRIGFW